jgi:hypothetical protein
LPHWKRRSKAEDLAEAERVRIFALPKPKRPLSVKERVEFRKL